MIKIADAEDIMKGSKIKLGLLILLLSLLFITESSRGAVKGNCSNCHTMHRSQTAWPWDMNWGGPASDPVENLLVVDCLGCHTNYTDGASTVELGSGATKSTVPIVYNVSPPANPLAGGNFYWVAQGDDTKGHNVLGIAGVDTFLSDAPGKFISCGPSCHASLAVEQTVQSELGSGCLGCHLNPKHHADDSNTVVDATGGWYRFLSGHMSGSNQGVEGIEDDDWQSTKSASDHNEYLGYVGVGGWGFNGLGHTTTGFCTACHCNFHASQGSISPWLMHPSEVVIPDSGEFADAFGAGGSGTGTYDPDIPVARPSLASVSNNVNIDTDQVMCLSCHRSHGSPYSKMLRWDYRGNDWSGCGSCHTWKQ